MTRKPTKTTQNFVCRILAIVVTGTTCVFVLSGVASAATFLIIDCNQNGTESSQPFGQDSSCLVGTPGQTASVTTSSFVSYVSMGSGLNLTQLGPYGRQFSTLMANYDTLTIGGLPAGTPIELDFQVLWAGSYNAFISYPGYKAEFATTQTLDVGQSHVISALEIIPVIAPGGSGGVSYSARGFLVTSAGQKLPFYWAFTNEISTSFSPASMNDTFIDPAQLTISATDPTTGAPLLGVTVTGSDGFQYPVNAACTQCQYGNGGTRNR